MSNNLKICEKSIFSKIIMRNCSCSFWRFVWIHTRTLLVINSRRRRKCMHVCCVAASQAQVIQTDIQDYIEQAVLLCTIVPVKLYLIRILVVVWMMNVSSLSSSLPTSSTHVIAPSGKTNHDPLLRRLSAALLLCGIFGWTSTRTPASY